MTRAKAIDRVRKLREMTVARGATESEELIAKQKADELIARFQIADSEIAPPEQPRLVPIQQAAPWYAATPTYGANNNQFVHVTVSGNFTWVVFGA